MERNASRLPIASPKEEDTSILSLRVGYDKPEDSTAIVICADKAEREFLIQQQKVYRHAPDHIITRLREINAQIKILGPSYSNLSEMDQRRFEGQVTEEITQLKGALEGMKGIKRPKMTPQEKKWVDARNGAILQCVEAATLGMPLEVWKTRMGRFRNENTIQALVNVYKRAGGGFQGVSAFWAGTSAKMVEAASKGAVLMVSKELIKDSCIAVGINPSTAGFLAGAGGGVCQTTVMGPCTFLVTSVVTGDKNTSLMQHIRNTWRMNGIQGFYPGGIAIAFRQATNWASRQGFTDACRELIKKRNYENPATAKLTINEEVLAGIMGGAVSCWNHPFEVARIEAQSRAINGQSKLSMMGIFKLVYAEHGVSGLFKGVIPRIGLGIWQTIFMVSGANIIRTKVLHEEKKSGGAH